MVALTFLVLFVPFANAVRSADTGTNSGRSDLQVGEQAREKSLEETWSAELDTDSQAKPKSPVKRVVLLLEQMRAELVAEGNKESEMYDKMVCWCETNEKEKTKAVSDGEGRIA